MAGSLKLTPSQASDVEAASEAIYASAADQVISAQAGLGRDLLALATVFLIVVTCHLINPLLQFEVNFGRAFRNATLQPVLAVGLLICALMLISNGAWGGALWRSLARNRLRLAASVVLFAYTAIALLAIVLRFNLIGAILGLPQEGFTEPVSEDGPVALFETALTITMALEYLALAAVVVLWEPWNRMPVYTRAVRRNAPVVLVALAVLVIWEAALVVFNIQQFLLPRPSVIIERFIDTYHRGLISVGWNTFQNAFWGFVVGCGLGILTGLISARFTSFSRALLPLAIAANSVPIIAFAPIMNNWFGALNPASKIAIVAVLTYFPSMISTVKGLTSVDTLSLELMQSYAASPLEIFRKLRLPTALPFIFSALKVSTTLAMIGAIVSEYFGGSTQGLGYRIREDAALFKYPESWAAIIVASVLGILFYLLVSAVERAVMPWHVSFREE
ncbi:MAG: ABC transporter permease [Chloroflexota bacterium]